MRYKHFVDVLRLWQYPWLWKDLKFTGDGTWVYEAIQNGSLVCVSDGSYLKELHPHMCSAAIMMECSQGGGRLSLALTDQYLSANAFRGELLGLMAIHLLLHSISITHPDLTGNTDIYSDCMGALQTISNLPAAKVPPKWNHTDILKIISLHGHKIPFHSRYHHVKARQDDNSDWVKLA
jgi:hypothetical protein